MDEEYPVETYRRALTDLKADGKMTIQRIKILQSQYQSEKHDVTASQLALLMGWGSHGSANLHYGKLGALFAPYFSVAPAKYRSGRPMNFSLLSSWWHDGTYYHWTMRPALAQALEELGLVSTLTGSPDIIEPEFGELPHRTYAEGATRQVTVNAHERNRAAREDCIARHGTLCAACDSDLTAFYGPVAEGFIHVHHLKPLSELSERSTVDPITDLRPVCPNCHAMLHRRTPPYTIEELRTMIQEARR